MSAMRHTIGVGVLSMLLAAGVASALQFDLYPISTAKVTSPRLVNVMPGQPVAYGTQDDKLYLAFGRDGGQSWEEVTLAFPEEAPDMARWQPFCVLGRSPGELLLGGYQPRPWNKAGHFPVWYRNGLNPFTMAVLGANTPRDVANRQIHSLTYGDASGQQVYAFGEEALDYGGKRARVWESHDGGVRWTEVLRDQLEGHTTIRAHTVSRDGVTWGATNKSLFRLDARGFRLLPFPGAAYSVFSMSAPQSTLAHLVQINHSDPRAPYHIHSTWDGGGSWHQDSWGYGRLDAADLLGKRMAVLAIQEGRAARLHYSRDGCATWEVDRVQGGIVRGARIVTDNEVYLLVQSLDGIGRVHWLRWKPTWPGGAR
jgi:hypothetical protein